MIKAIISEHDDDYHGTWCGNVEKVFDSVEQAKRWCLDNSERPYSYILSFAYDVDTRELVYKGY